jgi:hypothetical protein
VSEGEERKWRWDRECLKERKGNGDGIGRGLKERKGNGDGIGRGLKERKGTGDGIGRGLKERKGNGNGIARRLKERKGNGDGIARGLKERKGNGYGIGRGLKERKGKGDGSVGEESKGVCGGKEEHGLLLYLCLPTVGAAKGYILGHFGDPEKKMLRELVVNLSWISLEMPLCPTGESGLFVLDATLFSFGSAVLFLRCSTFFRQEETDATSILSPVMMKYMYILR